MTVRTAISLLLCVGLVGCGDDGMNDLREFVANAHADRKPNVEALPEMKPYEAFQYTAVNLPDPFSAANLRPLAATGNTGGPRPDMNRRKEALEDYPLDALKMVGTLSRQKRYWAIIQAPDGTVHRAQIGNFMGQNFGKVIKISDEKVELVELIAGGAGEWIEREASLAIVE